MNKIEKSNISRFKANDFKAFCFLVTPLLLLVIGVFLTARGELPLYFLGQFLLSIFFLQTFILLHECGHLNYFKTRSLNLLFGNIFGFFTMIPFYSWQHMHNLHHKWTGWRDKDPTTEKTVEPSNSMIMRVIANIAWWLFIPLFYIVYKISNYWNISKIKRHLNKEKYSKALMAILIYTIIYVVLFLFFYDFILRFVAISFGLSLIWKELIIMTQHSHIEIPISNGEDVKPVKFANQVQYSRSFYINKLVARVVLFNFNLHEAHHVYPGVPAYWLDKVDLGIEEKPSYMQWFLKAKSMKAEDYVFRTSKHTEEYF